MLSRCFTFAVFCSIVAVTAPDARADLIVNGGFEAPGFTVPPYYRYLSDGDTSITGWTIHNDRVGEAPYWVNFGAPGSPYVGSDYEGSYSLYLNAGSSIETTFAAMAGTNYILSFWSRAGTNTVAPLSVSIDGTSTSFTAPNGLQSFAFTATVTDPHAVLKFSNVSTGPDFQIYVLDAVSLNVQSVPEPANVVMLGIGAALGVVGYGWRRRKVLR